MNDVLIECFRAATETLNFTTAAQMIHISQPSFSRNIAMLEEEIGVLEKQTERDPADSGRLHALQRTFWR